MSSTTIPKVVPAQLSFLAIYNPSLGRSDDTVQDQIVFYYSKAAKARLKINGDSTEAARDLRERENEKLRQVGLAQGMVGFAKSFSNGDPVDSVETEKSRIVLQELERGWWILASIDLTQLPANDNITKAETGRSAPAGFAIEYSSREVSPPALLLRQLKRANSGFLLHHGQTLEGLFEKLGRAKFCNALDRYWTKFATRWDVLLHGSPAVDIFGGMKLASGGELGVGVGEEEWGSGEREVLEDFARRTDGLVDLMVSRFGEPSPLQVQSSKTEMSKASDTADLEPWLGRGQHVNAGDGVVFSGVGALSRRSLRDVSQWVEDIYTFGEYAYGVKDSPTADRRKRRKRNPDSSTPSEAKGQISVPSRTTSPSSPAPGIPPPIVRAAQSSLDKASNAVDSSRRNQRSPGPVNSSLADTESWMRYLTLGYGTTWGGKRSYDGERNSAANAGDVREPSPEVSMRYVEPEPEIDRRQERLKRQVQLENSGYFVIGLKGSMEEDQVDDDNDDGHWNNRIPLRTVHVEVLNAVPETPNSDSERPAYVEELSPTPTSGRKLSRLRAVVYVHRPFVYTFLFHQRTESLTLGTFYRNLHTYFSPLHRPLSSSTSPDRVRARLSAASHPYTTSPSSTPMPNTQLIYDLIYDPRTFTVHSSIPNIPEPGTLIAEGLSSNSVLSGWSRAEALNVHSQVVATVVGTRRTGSELERTCKTSRGWWVVWLRLPPSAVEPLAVPPPASEESIEFNVADLREAFLVRRAHDVAVSSAKTSGSSLGTGLWGLGLPSTGQKMGGAAAGWGPRGLAEGIGIDARKYVESLLSLSR